MEALSNFSSMIRTYLNYLLPFTSPNTPLWQDAIHTLIICIILYYAPTILEEYTSRHLARERAAAPAAETLHEPHNAANQSEDDADELRTNGDAVNTNDHEFAGLEGEDVVPEAIIPEPEEDAEAGPGNGFPRAVTSGSSMRNVGKKKAASLARKDQKRAYHEFQRAQGEAQRARDREAEEATRLELEEARVRRKKVEEEVERKAKVERERKREEERLEREKEIGRRKRVVEKVRQGLREKGWVRLKDVDAEGLELDIVEKLCRAEGLVGEKAGEKVINTKTGCLVKIEDTDLVEAYQRALVQNDSTEDGKVTWHNLGHLLEKVIMEKMDVQTGQSPTWDWEREKLELREDGWDDEVEHPAYQILRQFNS
jgi:hypothetical protein